MHTWTEYLILLSKQEKQCCFHAALSDCFWQAWNDQMFANFYGLLTASEIKVSDGNYYVVNEANQLFLNNAAAGFLVLKLMKMMSVVDQTIRKQLWWASACRIITPHLHWIRGGGEWDFICILKTSQLGGALQRLYNFLYVTHDIWNAVGFAQALWELFISLLNCDIFWHFIGGILRCLSACWILSEWSQHCVLTFPKLQTSAHWRLCFFFPHSCVSCKSWHPMSELKLQRRNKAIQLLLWWF